MATPLPKPPLAITPRAPLAPPVPLPYPGPAGRSNEPSCAMFTGLPPVSLAGIPLGSPKPPVCTFSGARVAIVGVAELPVEKTLVLIVLGITGLAAGSGSSFLAAILTCGAAVSSLIAFGFGVGAGTRNASGAGSTLAATVNLGSVRTTGCGV